MTQLIRVAGANDAGRAAQLSLLGCPNVNARDEDGSSALGWASLYDHEATIRELLCHGADANVMDNDGWTPLMLASK